MQNADTALRLLSPRPTTSGAGDGDSLQNVNTSKLPNGSLCWVISNDTLYRLDKSSTLNVGTIIPVGGPGRWIPVVAAGSGSTPPFAGESILEIGGGGTVTPVGANQWVALTSLGAHFVGNNSPEFALAATGGALTYSGPPKWFSVRFEISFRSNTVTTDFIEAVADLNGAALPNVSMQNAALCFSNSGASPQNQSASQFFRLVAGDVITPLVRSVVDGAGMLITYAQMHATAL